MDHGKENHDDPTAAEPPTQTSSTASRTDTASHPSLEPPATRATSILDPAKFPQTISAATIYISLVIEPLDIPAYLRFTRSPLAGANVLFLGTTRNNFDNRPVSRLSYSAYPTLALKSLFAIAEDVQTKYGLVKVAIVHRLGEVKIEEESIAVAVSSGHRARGWQGAEEILERVKARAEIWKREWFADTGEAEEGVWRSNKDSDAQGKFTAP